MRRLIVSFALIAPLLLVAIWPRSPLAALALLMLSHALVLYPTFTPNSQWLGPVVTHFETDEPEVWLTIDDGPTQATPQVLEVLRRHGVRATFFVKGSAAANHREVIAAAAADGHTIGNHSHTHPSGLFWALLPSAVTAQVDACDRVLKQIGVRTTLFRAPVGMKNPFVHSILERRGLVLVGWSIRALDALNGDVTRIMTRVVSQLHPGAIIVMHEGRSWSASTLDSTIRAVHSAGYRFTVPSASRLKTKK